MRDATCLGLLACALVCSAHGCARTNAGRQFWWRGQPGEQAELQRCELGWRLDDGRCITAATAPAAQFPTERHPVVAESERSREPSAAEACANDRRCRLERIKRKNQARRVTQRLHEEEVVAALVAEQEQERRRAMPRTDKPWLVDHRSSRFGLAGLDVGFSFAKYFQAGTSYMHDSDDVWFEGDLNTAYGGWNGRLATHWWTTGVALLPYTGPVTPYASVAFARVWGGFDSEVYVPRTIVLPDGSTFVETDIISRRLEVELHAVELQAGIDFQAAVGFHARLGAIYRAPVYTQARTGPGEYDAQVRASVEEWYDDHARFDFALTLGWAF